MQHDRYLVSAKADENTSPDGRFTSKADMNSKADMGRAYESSTARLRIHAVWNVSGRLASG
jgi:hypothetical protein